MKRLSKKRILLLSEASPWRAAFKLEVGKCELCGKRRGLIIHEISRGYADRKKSLMSRFAVLCLCDPGCHQIVEKWPRSRQLCLLFVRRPYDYDLPAFHALTSRVHPDHGEVSDWIEQVTRELGMLPNTRG